MESTATIQENMETDKPVTYLYPGYEEANIVVSTPNPKRLIRIRFKGGNPAKGRPAEATIRQPFIRECLERHYTFRTGRIRIKQHNP